MISYLDIPLNEYTYSNEYKNRYNQIELKDEGIESDSATVIETPIMDEEITTGMNNQNFPTDETNPIKVINHYFCLFTNFISILFKF